MRRVIITGISIEKSHERGKIRIGTECETHEEGDYVTFLEAEQEMGDLHKEIAILRARIAELEAPKK